MLDLEERVSGMESRLTRIETEIPHLKESLDRNTKSNEKMTDVLDSLEKTMENIHYTTLSGDRGSHPQRRPRVLRVLWGK